MEKAFTNLGVSFIVYNPTLPAAEAITTIAKYVNHYIRAGMVPLQGRNMKPLVEMCCDVIRKCISMKLRLGWSSTSRDRLGNS